MIVRVHRGIEPLQAVVHLVEVFLENFGILGFSVAQYLIKPGDINGRTIFWSCGRHLRNHFGWSW
jgi:hypothetical protein